MAAPVTHQIRPNSGTEFGTVPTSGAAFVAMIKGIQSGNWDAESARQLSHRSIDRIKNGSSAEARAGAEVLAALHASGYGEMTRVLESVDVSKLKTTVEAAGSGEETIEALSALAILKDLNCPPALRAIADLKMDAWWEKARHATYADSTFTMEQLSKLGKPELEKMYGDRIRSLRNCDNNPLCFNGRSYGIEAHGDLKMMGAERVNLSLFNPSVQAFIYNKKLGHGSKENALGLGVGMEVLVGEGRTAVAGVLTQRLLAYNNGEILSSSLNLDLNLHIGGGRADSQLFEGAYRYLDMDAVLGAKVFTFFGGRVGAGMFWEIPNQASLPVNRGGTFTFGGMLGKP